MLPRSRRFSKFRRFENLLPPHQSYQVGPKIFTEVSERQEEQENLYNTPRPRSLDHFLKWKKHQAQKAACRFYWTATLLTILFLTLLLLST